MTTRLMGGTVTAPNGSPLGSVPVEIELVLAEAFVVTGSYSLAGKLRLQTDAAGRWSTPLQCNDDLTPVGTLYQATEKVPSQYGGAKVYLFQVLTGLPVAPAVNEVLNSIVPEALPVGGTYSPVGSGPQGIPGPIGPAGYHAVANRSELDAYEAEDGESVLQLDRGIVWTWDTDQFIPVNMPSFATTGQRDLNYTEKLPGHTYYLASDDKNEGPYYVTSDPSYRKPWNIGWGFLQRGTGPVSQTDYTTQSVAVILTVSGIPANRWLRFYAFISGTQISANGTPVARMRVDGVEVTRLPTMANTFLYQINAIMQGSNNWWVPSTGSDMDFDLTVQDTGGAVRVAAQQGVIVVEDAGPLAGPT